MLTMSTPMPVFQTTYLMAVIDRQIPKPSGYAKLPVPLTTPYDI
jgi:hypothetical protein